MRIIGERFGFLFFREMVIFGLLGFLEWIESLFWRWRFVRIRSCFGLDVYFWFFGNCVFFRVCFVECLETDFF